MNTPDRLAFLKWRDYGIGAEAAVWGTLHCTPDQIEPIVVLAPYWSPSIFKHCRIQSVAKGIATVDKVTHGEMSFTMVRTGIGAPLAGDAVLALGCTACTHLIFVGSVGGLDPSHQIGDLLVPTESLTGDGFSSFLVESLHGPQTPPSQSVPPDQDVRAMIVQMAEDAATPDGVSVFSGSVYSSDTILAQFHHLSWITNQLGCIGIEMETSAVFRAARVCGIKAAALLQVSDVSTAGKSLYAGRSDTEQKRRKRIRTEILAPAVLKTVKQLVQAA